VSPHAGAQSSSESQTIEEAERSGRPFLVYRDGAGKQRVFVFTAGVDSASVGRRSASDLVIDWDEQVSRLHARLERADGAWVIVDDGLSSNGTFVNEQRVNGSQPLRDGDSIRFGATVVAFRAPTPPPAPAPVRAPSPPPPPPSGGPGQERARVGVSLSSTQRRVLAALCRPYKGASGFASPATDEQIAEELVLSPGEVGAHLRVLHAKLGVPEQPPHDARTRLVERAFADGLISERDL
jgi:pSer/pThr/pTyr-binding forkhead associated (FHA) protein